MTDAIDNPQVIARPPLLWLFAMLVGAALDDTWPLPFLPQDGAGLHWAGAAIFAGGLLLLAWAAVNFQRAGTNVPTNRPTTAIVATGPYRFSRNPIYTAMLIGQVGVAIYFDNAWQFVTAIPFIAALRYGVIAREEAYLERKFGSLYLDYKARVRRWL
jgi:protein-S-isoprenylcysteine O-methyltransferase Ste14